MPSYIDNYFSKKAVNSSLLKTMSNPINAQFLYENWDVESQDVSHFRVGSAVDIALTNPTIFNETFEVIDCSRPYGLMGKFIDNLPCNLQEDSAASLYEDAYRISKYKTDIKSVIKALWANDKNIKYYLAKSKAGDKQILSIDEFKLVVSAKRSIFKSDAMRKYFIPDDNPDYIVFHQVPIYWEENGMEFKVLLDGILIDKANGLIIPFDLKTTAKSVYDWYAENFYDHGYYLQCALYMRGLKELMRGAAYTTHPQKDIIELYLDQCGVTNFKFIIISKRDDREPVLAYTVSDASMKEFECASSEIIYKETKYMSLRTCISELRWHLHTNNWITTKKIYEDNFEIEI